MTAPVRARLEALARAWGVEPTYVDAFGTRHLASPESLVAVHRALGAPIERPEDATEALETRQREIWTCGLEPVTVVWEDTPAEALVRFPAGSAARLGGELVLENGERLAVEAETDRLTAVGSAELDGREIVAARLPLPRSPLGYHVLRLDRGVPAAESLVIHAPRTTYPIEPERGWGIFLPLYALRSSRDWGAGDLTDLRQLLRWTERQGGSLVGTLPLLAAFLDAPFEPSPYAPASRLFWNEAYVDPERAPGWRADVLDVLPPSTVAIAAERAALRQAPEVEMRRVLALKRELLDRLARRFFVGGGEQDPEFREFLATTPFLPEYARFRAAVELHGGSWRGWPERMRRAPLRPVDYGSERVAYHLFVQWAAERQLRDAVERADPGGAGLYLDLPAGVHPESFDTWRFREQFVSDVSFGAPPDDFFSEGQNWGLPPPHPERMREDGYAYERACLRHTLRHARALRLDHVMGLHRLFWVPEGAPVRQGLYVRYRQEERWAILCLESHRHRTAIVGEDLGTVPPEVREALEAHDTDGMYVVQFETRADGAEALCPVPPRSLAMLDTHDTYPFAAFWSGADIEDRRRRGLLDTTGATEERKRRQGLRAALGSWLGGMALFEGPPTGEKVLRATVAVLAVSPARTVMVNLEDLWLEPRPQNVPGTPATENWRRKARYRLEELLDLPSVQRVLGTLAHLRGDDARMSGGGKRSAETGERSG